MELVENQSLDTLVSEAITNAINSDAIAKKVQASAEKAITETIDAAFGYNSPFRDGIKKAIGQVLPIANADDVATFGNAVREIIQQRLSRLASETAEAHLAKVIDDLLPESPVVTMKELREAYVDKLKEQATWADCHCDESDEDPEYTWQIDTGKSNDKYWDLWMSSEPDASRYSGKDLVVLRFRPVDDGSGLQQCWHARVDGHDCKAGSLFSGPLFGFDAMVFRLATGIAKLQK